MPDIKVGRRFRAFCVEYEILMTVKVCLIYRNLMPEKFERKA